MDSEAKAMVFDIKNRNISNLAKLKINNKSLKYVDKFTYLGILLNRRLNFRLHHGEFKIERKEFSTL